MVQWGGIIDEWIKKYNEERPHQSLNYLTLIESYQNETVRKVA